MLVSSVPLSETIIAGRLRVAMTASSSRATRRPDRDVSATRHRHSAVKSSTTASTHAIENPIYKRALQQYSGDSAAVNAIDEGFGEGLSLEPELIGKTSPTCPQARRTCGAWGLPAVS